ncbi:hypothetical protein V1511DRAFT_507886 [Dipodascopsis uninucleata]
MKLPSGGFPKFILRTSLCPSDLKPQMNYTPVVDVYYQGRVSRPEDELKLYSIRAHALDLATSEVSRPTNYVHEVVDAISELQYGYYEVSSEFQQHPEQGASLKLQSEVLLDPTSADPIANNRQNIFESASDIKSIAEILLRNPDYSTPLLTRLLVSDDKNKIDRFLRNQSVQYGFSFKYEDKTFRWHGIDISSRHSLDLSHKKSTSLYGRCHYIDPKRPEVYNRAVAELFINDLDAILYPSSLSADQINSQHRPNEIIMYEDDLRGLEIQDNKGFDVIVLLSILSLASVFQRSRYLAKSNVSNDSLAVDDETSKTIIKHRASFGMIGQNIKIPILHPQKSAENIRGRKEQRDQKESRPKSESVRRSSSSWFDRHFQHKRQVSAERQKLTRDDEQLAIFLAKQQETNIQPSAKNQFIIPLIQEPESEYNPHAQVV